jgi:thiol-disulfide isomerase/thioredoxin
LKPIVDGLEQELGERIRIIRVNIHESTGRELGPIMRIEAAPTFIYFDGQGNEVWRQIGAFEPQKVRDSLGP